jgi:superfamily II DNA or RNA helicase
MSELKVGDRVIYSNHPEYGFGIVKMIEEDVLGDTRCQVSFDHLDHYTTVRPEDVKRTKSPQEAFRAGELGTLLVLNRRLAAGAVIGETNLTGAFLRVAVQPLPHQSFLLDKVLSRNRFGHLLADDVGLGKTIEAGLLISSLLEPVGEQKVLIVCPAGLALQWQEEMEEHFSLYFSVLGKNADFNGKTVGGWRGRRLVIAPIDQIKRKEYADILRQVGPFHLVVCDEAHRLGARREFLSNDLRTTANYRLFKELVDAKIIEFVPGGDGVPRSPRLLLLTATPHQGDDLRFGFLLRLIRPDLFTRADETIVPEFTVDNLLEAVTRTPKSRAVDWEGKGLFKGHVTHTLDVDWTESEETACELLTHYIHLSLAAAHAGSPGIALVIELVMHTFHKIAASSWPALAAALKARRDAINDGSVNPDVLADEEEEDVDRWEADLRRPPFFSNEKEMLDRLLEYLESLQIDTKWDLCAELLRKLEDQKPGVKVLLFTQYRTTQLYLRKKVQELFSDEVEIINGDVGLQDRREARRRFEDSSRFMISTEAGGEGINLQRACHVMINYDLPWNPMRLQQRIGRLDRYLQKEVVQVFNLRVMNSWDCRISSRILERLAVIQKTMGLVTLDAEDYREMILGAVADQIDETKLFVDAQADSRAETSDAQIDQWIQNALGSVKRWEKVFNRDLGMPEGATLVKPRLTSDDFRRAFAAVLEQHALRLMETRTQENKFVDGVFHFPLPMAFKDPILRPSPEVYLTFDREKFSEVRGQVLGKARGQEIKPILAGFGEPVTDWLFESSFAAVDGESAFIVRVNRDWVKGDGWLCVAALRWKGRSRRLKTPDSLAVCFQDLSGACELLNPPEIMQLIRCGEVGISAVVEDGAAIPSLEDCKALVQGDLRRLLENRDPGARSVASWSWLAVARIVLDGPNT